MVAWTSMATGFSGIHASALTHSRINARMVDDFRWSKAAGTKANIEEVPKDYVWKRAKHAVEEPKTDDGACYIVDEAEAPDPSRDWFFCSDPSDDETMVCELVPEWMGTAPSGDHAVWLCSTPKVSEKDKQ